MSPKAWVICGAVLGGLSVALGAFGAHGLLGALESQGLSAADLARRLENWETAARYHMYHALALIAVGWIASRSGGAWSSVAGWCFIVGTAIFSGCLYALVLSGVRVLGAIVPIGGVLLIVGWLSLAIAAAKSR